MDVQLHALISGHQIRASKRSDTGHRCYKAAKDIAAAVILVPRPYFYIKVTGAKYITPDNE